MNKYQRLIQERFLDNEDAVINALKSTYEQSYKDITKKIESLDLSIERLQKAYNDIDGDEIGELAQAFLSKNRHYTPEEARETLQSMIQSKVYQRDYQKALEKQIDGVLGKMLDKEYETISDYLTECYEDSFIGTMFDMQSQGIPLCFPLDQEAIVNAVQLNSPIKEGLYNHLGENVGELKTRIASEVSRGIATGMSYAVIARNIRANMMGTYENPGGSYAYALRIARTEGHRIQCQATMDACFKAREKGADVAKQWDATLDSKTRESHARIHREIRELDEKFSNGLMFPGDPSGGAAEVINCRCGLNQRARWALEGGFMQYDGFSKEIKTFEDTEAFEEFKKAYFSKENRQYMNYVEKLEDRYQTKDFNKLLKSMNEREYNHFIKLQDKRPQFNGMYRGDDIIKKSKQKSADILTKNPNDAITKNGNNQLKPFTKVKVDDIPSMDESRFKTIKGSLEKKGVSVIQDAAGDDFLQYMGAEAMTLSDGSAVIFQSKRIPSASAVFEEIIHTTQIKIKGMVETTGDIKGTLEYLNREIEANEKLLKHKEAYSLTAKDVESVQENLDMYYKKLKEVEQDV